ncbi:MAG TPA: hypothetical protein VJP80_00080 [Candidatus Saccharimonadales bacterium]|nr:hypothetical protein [Candidatus Saccharimonadales bacterium]
MTDPTGYVAACGTGKANCPDSESGSVTVKTTAHELGSHIAVHGMTTITTTREANGNTVQTASGNGFGLGETAEVSVDRGGGNGAQMTQSATSAQTQPTTHTDIGSPANQSLGCTQIVCSGDKIELNNPYRNPHNLETSNQQILRTELNEAVVPLAFPKPDPAGSKTDSVGYGYHLDSIAKIRLYKRQLNKDGSLSAAGADFLTRNFEQTYVHSVIAREVHVDLTQGQYNAASDFVYQHGHLPLTFRLEVNQRMYFMAGSALYDQNYPGRTNRDVNEFLKATPGNLLLPFEP